MVRVAQRVPPRLAHGDVRPAALVPHAREHGDEKVVARMTPPPRLLVQHHCYAERVEPCCPAREQTNRLLAPYLARRCRGVKLLQPGGGKHPPNTNYLRGYNRGRSQRLVYVYEGGRTTR